MSQSPDQTAVIEDLVSIITPSYNTVQFVEETVRSIQAQTYRNWELLIVDDASKDGSVERIERIAAKDSRIRFETLSENRGPAYARNTAIRKARGRYIAFLDSDDLWLPEKLERQVRFMKEQQIAFSYTQYQKIDEQGNRMGGVIPIPDAITYSDLLLSCVIGCLTVILDIKRLGKYYMPNIPKGQDYGLWLAILRDGHMAYGFQENLALYRIRKNSISRNKLKKAYYQWRIYRQVEKLSMRKSLFLMANYAYFGYRRMKT